ncbi:hypothetical protein [Actinomadura sp. 9N215]|uniref:hypothetical protein n=1 Tax=Actinomadura sp. 9N215 TaxID=3375150 RepID=UPI003794E316
MTGVTGSGQVEGDEFERYRAVLARPDDHALRRASAGPDQDRAVDLLRLAEAEQRAVHGPGFAAPLDELVEGYTVHEGLVTEVAVPLDRFGDVIDRVLALAPVRHVALTAPRRSPPQQGSPQQSPAHRSPAWRTDLRSALRDPHLSLLTSLSLDGLGLDDQDAVAIAFSELLRGLPCLSLAGNRIGRTGVEALAASPWLAETEVLDLRGNPCDPLPRPVSRHDYGVFEARPVVYAELPPEGSELVSAYGEPKWLRVPFDVEAWPPSRDALVRRHRWTGHQSMPSRNLATSFVSVAGLARTTTEAHLYMDLRPCLCGEHRFPRRSFLAVAGENLAGCYSGSCAGCGRQRAFGFRLPPGGRPGMAAGLPFGGSEPSRLLDPGEWLTVADDPAVPAALAVAALDEALKFVPPGADAVPEAAFTSAAGRAMHATAPTRFRADNLKAAHGALQGEAGQHQ